MTIHYLDAVGFMLLGGVFVWAGGEHFLRFEEIACQLKFPLPRFLLATGSAVEIIAGVCLAAGVWRTYAALALVAFTAVVSFTILSFWNHSGPERSGMRSAFTINIAVIGGLLVAATAPG
jgi:putative oxidoreductase